MINIDFIPTGHQSLNAVVEEKVAVDAQGRVAGRLGFVVKSRSGDVLAGPFEFIGQAHDAAEYVDIARQPRFAPPPRRGADFRMPR
ncbi:hypothetical protein [Amantichitinum ursilacus]|uniref:Uncharacterized protein n=1 Tax=Amantichitinum ursilacus TaxID=857265 RepID=A0A0N0GQT5_9NEIS|nr:hypothetical protein [Amantichitinum ursilacus]KPC55041.1 hypothetical protein WG78_00240 [Amantichitinum ursilacus]